MPFPFWVCWAAYFYGYNLSLSLTHICICIHIVMPFLSDFASMCKWMALVKDLRLLAPQNPVTSFSFQLKHIYQSCMWNNFHKPWQKPLKTTRNIWGYRDIYSVKSILSTSTQTKRGEVGKFGLLTQPPCLYIFYYSLNNAHFLTERGIIKYDLARDVLHSWFIISKSLKIKILHYYKTKD